MIVQKFARLRRILPVLLVCGIAFALQGCMFSTKNLHSGMPSVAAKDFFGTGKHVFKGPSDYLFAEVLSGGLVVTRDNLKQSGKRKTFFIIQKILKPKDFPKGHYLAFGLVDDKYWYFPFVYRKKSITLHMVGNEVKSKTSLRREALKQYRQAGTRYNIVARSLANDLWRQRELVQQLRKP
jgi:hypothetical protein